MSSQEKVEAFLLAGETVARSFRASEERTVFLTDRRMFLVKGNSVTEVPFASITAVDLVRETPWVFLVLAIVLLGLGLGLLTREFDLLFRPFLPSELTGAVAVLVGILFAILFVLRRKAKIKAYVLARPPVDLGVKARELEEFLQIVRGRGLVSHA